MHTHSNQATGAFCLAASSCAVALGILLIGGGSAEGQTRPHILLSNDDGIESPGIQVLARELSRIGEVVVVAPCEERSGSSMSIALAQQLRLRPFELEEDIAAYCVNATPAGAVMLGLRALSPEGGFDVVVSGINRGANVGDLAHMSGTIGAAMMGAYLGVPSVAASLGDRGGGFDYAARFVTKFVSGIADLSPEPGIVYSINLPKGTEAETRGVTAAPMGGSYLRIEYEEGERSGAERIFDARFRAPDPYPEGSDSEAYASDYITITPLRFDWTATDVISQLRDLRLDHRTEGGR